MSLPYDPEGSNPLNLKTEVRRLSELPNPFNCIIPTFAPFFRKDFVLTTADGVELYEGMDYYFALYYEELSNALKRPIFGGIVLNDPTIEIVKFERYRSTGGNHLAHQQDVVNYLRDPEMNPPRSTDWSFVLQRTVDIVVEPAPETMEEALERDIVLKGLRLLTDSVMTLGQNNDTKMNAFLDRMTRLTQDWNATQIEKHLGDTGLNAHPITPEQLNLALKTDTATDAEFLHTANKATVLAETRALQLQYSDLDKLANKANLEILGLLGMVNGVRLSCAGGVAIENEETKLSVSYNQGEFHINVIVPEGGVANLFLSSMSNNFTFNSGKDVCYVNGLPILDRARAPEYIRPDIEGADRLVTRNSPTVTLIGEGTNASPISGDVAIAPATYAERGAFEVIDDGSREHVASSGYMFTLKAKIETLADKDFTINGHRFDKVIVLERADVKLGNVDNVPALEKELNLAFIEALKGYSLKTHKHVLNDIDGIRYANRSTKGLVKYTDQIIDDANLVIYTEQLSLIYSRYLSKLDAFNTTMSRDIRPGYRLENLVITETYDDVNNVMRVVISDFTLVQGNTSTVISGATFANLEGIVTIVNGQLSESNVGLKVCERRENKLLRYGVHAYPLTRQWLEHEIDPVAHEKAIVGGYYSLVENLPLVSQRYDYEAAPMTQWRRMSHDSFFGDQPARPDEMLAWAFSGVESDIVYPEKSVTFVSLLSEMRENYSFRTDVWFDLPDKADPTVGTNGIAVVILGGWVDTAGKEHTISVVFSDTALGGSDNNLASVWHNYEQPDGKLISILRQDEDFVNGWTYQAYKVLCTVTEYSIVLEVRPHEVQDHSDAYIYNLDKEFDKQYTFPISRRLQASEFGLQRFPAMGYGFGSKGGQGVNFRYRPLYQETDEKNYANQQYLKEASYGEVTETVVGHNEYPVNFTTAEKGVYTALVSSGDTVRLIDKPDFPCKITYDYGTSGTTITVKAIYLNGLGDELYEPPLTLEGLSVTLVDITY